jgi:iron complex outermembrane receptor protein
VLAVFPLASFADDDDGATVYFEEVIVTAERTERSVMDTAMTITGFGEDALKRFGIQDRDKLQILVPGLQFGETVDMLGNGTSLRGIGTRNAGIGHGDRSVATYIEGGYTVGTYGTAPGGGFDLERVEVARGPQGTLNGRNSIAGSINYIYKKPSQERDLELMGQYNDFQQHRVNVAIGGPLTENIAYRLTGGREGGDGYQENFGTGPDTDSPDHSFYSVQLRFQNDRFDSNVRYSKVRDQGVPRSQVPLANLNTTDEQIEVLGAYAIGNRPPAGVTVATVDNTNYLSAIQNPAGEASCQVGRPYMRCGDINNRVALNNTGFEDSEGEMLNFYAQYDFNDDISLRYTYSDNTVNQLMLRDGDYTSRVGGQGPAYNLATDGNVPYSDRQYYMIYDYEEESHELLLTWSLSDNTDLIVGAFAYESDLFYQLTRWEYSHDFRFTDSDEAAVAAEAAGGDWTAFGMDDSLSVTDCASFVQNVIGATFGLPVTDDGTGSYYVCPGAFGTPGRDGGDLRAIVPFGTGTLNETKAFFANIDHRFNEKWSASAGFRWLEDTKEQPPETFSGNFMFAFTGVPVVIGYQDGGLDEAVDFDKVVGQLSVEYTTDADNMIYGRISTGHKPGVFNFASPPVPGVPTVVEESTLTNYEAGFKGTYLDGRLQLAAGAFFMDYDKMHLEALQVLEAGFVPDQFNPTPLAEFVSAIPDTEVYGVELEYQYAFSETTSLLGFYAYTDSEIGKHSSVILGNPEAQFDLYEHLDFETGEMTQSWYELATDQTGNMLPSQAKHKASTSVLHNMALGNGSRVDLLVTWAYNGAWYPTIGNIDLYKVNAHSRFDASATWTAANEQLSAQFYINNLTDEIALNEFIAAGGHGGQVFLGSPTNHREMGVVVRWMPEW